MLITITPATTLPVTLEEAKAHLRVDHNDDNAQIQDKLKAAIEFVEKGTSLVLSQKELEYRQNAWPCDSNTIEIPAAPVRDVTALKYLDENAVEQTVDADDWTWERTPEGATLTFGEDFTAPDIHATRKNAVRVVFDAGFDDPQGPSGSGDDPDLQLPYIARIAVLMHLELEYERGGLTDTQVKQIETVRDSAIAQLRIYR